MLLLLDFEKAFDRIEWGFLFRALEQLGFSQTWVHWVTSLYREATSTIKVNGVPGPVFQLARSVRHGCPLAPYFFILAIDVLGYMLAVATLALGSRPRQRGCKGAGQEEAWESHQSVGECEGVSLHTPKATPKLGEGVLVDSRNFRERFEGSNLNDLLRSLYQ